MEINRENRTMADVEITKYIPIDIKFMIEWRLS